MTDPEERERDHDVCPDCLRGSCHGDCDPSPCGLCGVRLPRPGFTACGVCA